MRCRTSTSSPDLYRVAGVLVAVPGVVRMSTAASLHEQMPLRVRALLEELAGE